MLPETIVPFASAALTLVLACAPIAYLSLCVLQTVEAWKAIRCGEPCANKMTKALAYAVITVKAVMA
jgi:hypothetical protein